MPTLDNHTKAAVAKSSATDDTSMARSLDTNPNDEPNNVKDMLATVKKHSGGTNVLRESIITLSISEGSDKKGDSMVSDLEAALTLLKQFVEEAKKNTKTRPNKWDFRAVPNQLFGKTLDGTFLAFLMWARSDNVAENGAQNQSETGTSPLGRINVSKAFRRLEHYADWMEGTSSDLTEPALTTASVQEAVEMLAMKLSVDRDGRLVWWIDCNAIDFGAVKKNISPKDLLRAFVWYAHYVMYDTNAQHHGLVFVQNCNHVGFLQTVTLFPIKVGTQIDRLTIGVLPTKMNAMYILESATWMLVLMKFARIFMSKKMKKRIVFLDSYTELEHIVGKECVPKGFGKLEGTIDVDPVEERFFGK